MSENLEKKSFVCPWTILTLGVAFFVVTRFIPAGIVAALTVFLAEIFIHELHHWLWARIFGMRTPIMSVGYFTKPRLVLARFWGTTLQITPWLWGGFVYIIDESDAIWKRAVVIAAGPITNAILPVVVMYFMFSVIGLPMQTVAAGGSSGGVTTARNAQIKKGDLFVSVDGQPVHRAQDASSLISDRKQKPVAIVVRRDRKQLQFTVVPDADGKIGLNLVDTTVYTRLSAVPAFKVTIRINQVIFSETIRMWGRLVHIVKPESDEKAGGASSLHGPIGMVQFGAVQFNSGIYMFTVLFVGWLSWTFVIINTLVPIPPFDGGRLLLLGWEALGKHTGWWGPIPKGVQAKMAYATYGIVAILLLISVYNDLLHPVH